jgi:archaeal cell division control protein 6
MIIEEFSNSADDLWDMSTSIFNNKNVIKLTYVPKTINDALHRKDIIRKIQTKLLDIKSNLAPDNIFIYGKTGTGKTMITKLVIKDFKEVASKRNVKFTYIHVNCEESFSENEIFRKINEALYYELEGEVKEFKWNSRGKHKKQFDKMFFQMKNILIIILDEIDKLDKTTILNTLARTISPLTDQSPCLICIVNDGKFKEKLDPPTKSIIGDNEIQFNPYDANEINDILTERAKIAFRPNVLTEMVIPLCSALAAQEHGDARKAIQLLAKSGEIAEDKGKMIVEEEDVREANDIIEIERIYSIISTLPTQTKATLFAIILLQNKGKESSKSSTGEVYNMYRRICHHIDLDILTQRRVTDLLSELDMLGIINAVVVSKGRYGTTKEISLDIHKEQLRQILIQDIRFKAMDDFKISFL